MHAIVVWLDETTTVPSCIGPYQDFDNIVWYDANMLRARCHKVQVCNLASPEKIPALLDIVKFTHDSPKEQ